MRFNPPPNWPQPPAGWTPPPGWEPDPAWGPVPPGWQLWVADNRPRDAPPYGAPPGKSTGSKTGLIVGAVSVVLLLLVGAAVGAALLLRKGNESAPATPTTSATSTAPTSSGPATGPVSCSASNDGTKSTPNPLGAGATLGDYCAGVTQVVKDATSTVLSADPDNKPPKNGRFVLVTIATTYHGQTEGKAYLDLSVTLYGGDGKKYDDTACDARSPNDLIGTERLRPGQSLTGAVCLDVPPAALQGGVLSLENFATDDEVFWKLD